jgi:hypothetical protein
VVSDAHSRVSVTCGILSPLRYFASFKLEVAQPLTSRYLAGIGADSEHPISDTVIEMNKMNGKREQIFNFIFFNFAFYLLTIAHFTNVFVCIKFAQTLCHA